MSTSAVTAPSVESEVSALAHRHITLTYAVLGVLVLTLALAAFGGWLGYKAYDRALQRAEAAEAAYQVKETAYMAQQKQLTDLLAQDAQERAQASATQAKLVAQIAARAQQPLPPVVQTGLRPGAGISEVEIALGSVYSAPGAPVIPTSTTDGKVALSLTEAQQVTSQGVTGQRAEADLKDTQALYGLEQGKTTSLSNDLAQCQDTLKGADGTLAAANITIADYKKAAKRSKWQKIWSGMKTGALVVLAAYAGHKI